MSNAKNPCWDCLSGDEADFVEVIINDLANEPWAQGLLRVINTNGGLNRNNKAFFFELRFAYAVYRAGIPPIYEVQGEGASTLDFGFSSKQQPWKVELMRLEETAAVSKATTTRTDEDGVVWQRLSLSSDAMDPNQSEEGETLKAIEHICQKCEKGGRPHKFPKPANSYHALLVDFREFLNGGDVYDRIHVGLGSEYLSSPFLQRILDEKLISGVFNQKTNLKGATEIRERVHFLGFVDEEKKYFDGGFGEATQFIANPDMFESTEAMRAAIATWPLQPAHVINNA